MEKIIAVLWAPEGESRSDFNARVTQILVPALQQAGAKHLRLNLRDDSITAAKDLIQVWKNPQQDAVLQFWLPSSHKMFFAPIEAKLAQHSSRLAAWLVLESTIIPNKDHPPVVGERTYGWSQMAFLRFRADQSRDDNLAHWANHHTEVAIVTQSNFEYVQHIIARPLTPDAPAYHAIVEECFPPAAMNQPEAFFDAVGDPDRFAENTRRMMESCEGFLQFGELDVIPTSQFVIPDISPSSPQHKA